MNDFYDEIHLEIPAGSRGLIDSVSQTSRLMLTIDTSHAGIPNLNNRIYRPDMMKRGALSMVDRPVVKHHNDCDDAIGIVTDAEFVDIATDAFRSAHPSFMRAGFWTKDTPWDDIWTMSPEGLAKLVARAQVTDQDAQEKILDRRFLSVSIKFRTDGFDCTCGLEKADYWYEPKEDEEDLCSCSPGTTDKDGVQHFNVPRSLAYPHLSIVNEPADENAKILDAEFVDMRIWDSSRVVAPSPSPVYSLPSTPEDLKELTDRIANIALGAIRKDSAGEEKPKDMGKDIPFTDPDQVPETFKNNDWDEDALAESIESGAFVQTYIVESDDPSALTAALASSLASILENEVETGDEADIQSEANTSSEEITMTREELLALDTVQELLEEAKQQGADSRNEEVDSLNEKLDTANEELQSNQDRIDEIEKTALVDKLIDLRCADRKVSREDAGEDVIQEWTDGLMARSIESLNDSLEDEASRMVISEEDETDEEPEVSATDPVDDPGQSVEGTDDNDTKPKTELGGYLADVRQSL